MANNPNETIIERLARLEEQVYALRCDIKGNGQHTSVVERLERIEEKLLTQMVDFGVIKGKIAVLASVLSIVISAAVTLIIRFVGGFICK